jgi:3-dehydroquinate synthase
LPVTTLPIASAQGDYAVEFFASIEEALAAAARIDDPFFLVDRNVRALYRDELAFLEDARTLELDATEDEKTLAGVGRVVEFLQRNNATKKSTVVAIGGGIIQDLATFSSHIYYRGIRWAFVPTTLLSMSDSCIGAKCGINLGAFKNQLGVFQSPSAVLIATGFIRTLSDHDVASGHGEILKLMLTADPGGTGGAPHTPRSLDSARDDTGGELYAKLKQIVDAEGLRTEKLPELIYDSLAVKKQVIEEDEYEADLRRILNYGHTFGHALESLTAHEVPHGHGVAWGIDLVNHIAVSRGLLDRATFDDIHAFVGRHSRFRLSRRITAAELLAAARRDKKAAGGTVNLILLERPGSLKIVPVPFADLDEPVAEYLEHFDAFRGD